MNCEIHKDESIELLGVGFDGSKKYEDYWCTKCKEHKHIEVKE